MNDKTRKYVFLSYSHRDPVQKFLDYFDDLGFNVVYDETMSYGEEWDLKARRLIGSDMCCGAVVLLSPDSVRSKPVLDELGYMRLYRKNYFAISDAADVSVLFDTEREKAESEDMRYIVESVREFFPKQKLFLNFAEAKKETGKVVATLAEWGITPDRRSERRDYEMPRYTSELLGEEERLLNQQSGYYRFDMDVIRDVVGTFGDRPITVLDLGCSSGDVAYSRFAELPNVKKVIGVDYNPSDIRKANEKYGGGRFAFYELDLEDEHVVSKLNEVLRGEGIEKVDLVFMALTLHHLKKPQLLLLRLFDIFGEDGKIIIRGSDDGGKLFYPDSELMQNIFRKYDELSMNSSDRYNARKLYWLLSENGYLNTKMYYRVTDTCCKTRAEKEYQYKIGFEFRKNRLNSLVAKYPDDAELKRKVSEFEKMLEDFKLKFCSPASWYCVTSYIAVAGVNR